MSEGTSNPMTDKARLADYEEELRAELARPIDRRSVMANARTTASQLTDRGSITLSRVIDTRAAISLLKEAISRLEKLDGLTPSNPRKGSDPSARNVLIGNDLLFNAHLCRKAETLVAEEYHAFSGVEQNLLEARS
jgi:hypothetical protein